MFFWLREMCQGTALFQNHLLFLVTWHRWDLPRTFNWKSATLLINMCFVQLGLGVFNDKWCVEDKWRWECSALRRRRSLDDNKFTKIVYYCPLFRFTVIRQDNFIRKRSRLLVIAFEFTYLFFDVKMSMRSLCRRNCPCRVRAPIKGKWTEL